MQSLPALLIHLYYFCFWFHSSEEILQKHLEILQDVKQENERMMKERDRLQEQLEQIQKQLNQTESPSATSNGEGSKMKMKILSKIIMRKTRIVKKH